MSAAILRRIATFLALPIMALGLFGTPAAGVTKETLMTNAALWAGDFWLVVHAVAWCIDGRLLNN